jgi:hypothetical protein
MNQIQFSQPAGFSAIFNGATNASVGSDKHIINGELPRYTAGFAIYITLN